MKFCFAAIGEFTIKINRRLRASGAVVNVVADDGQGFLICIYFLISFMM